ncbi:thioesterase domain-containing protein [Paenibacillus amylolyticus]|uniref:thioesterase II family protein n=1 Tax=Paenibacillus amylolyticus TaxID=1451 RepID=UPI003241E5C4
MKLFCIPYAGGSAAIYNQWSSQLIGIAEIIPVELAGRGRRVHEPFYRSFEEVVEDVTSIIVQQLSGDPYAIFGHSLGAILAYETTHKLRSMGYKEPRAVFFSGRSAPHVPDKDEKIVHTLPDEEFIQHLVELGGTPPQFFENTELKNLFLPIIRSDFRLSETYSFKERNNKLLCDTYIFYGKQDDNLSGDIKEWDQVCHSACNYFEFDGDHFFIHSHSQSVIEALIKGLNSG